jgi:ATP-dependent DNA helicase PIF1
MANRAVLASVNDALKVATSSDTPFGGKVIGLLGDFRQTCPVVRNGGRADVVDASIRSSPLWTSFTVFHLTQPVRTAADPEFTKWLDDVGDGTLTDVEFTMVEKLSTVDLMVAVTFPDDILADPLATSRRSILAVKNIQVEKYNNRVLKRLTGQRRVYYATDTLKDLPTAGDGDDETTGGTVETRKHHGLEPTALLDYIAKQTPSGCPSWALTIVQEAVYRLLRNFSVARRLVKNARVLITQVGHRIVTVRLITMNGVEEEDMLIPRITFECETSRGAHVILRRQFPLAPAYATTFNSCQGLTLDKAAVDLTSSVFSHGQLYTALSRVRRRQDCMVLLPPGMTSTTNVVYPELLEDL